MRLTAAVVTELAQLRAAIKSQAEREKELADAIKDEMVEKDIDVFAPVASPYKAVKTEYDQSDVSWKDVAETAYRLIYKEDWQVELEKAKARFGKKHIIKLETPPNEHYRNGRAS